ncbi:hypothetical protein BDK51DRAFT_25069, partial [Blyttiomyces helicus]
TNVYVRGLSPDVSDEIFYDLCKSYGRIVSSKSIIDARTSECKGFGFVMYDNESQARAAIDGLSRRGFQVSFAKESFSARLKTLQDHESTNIYLSNLPSTLDEDQMAAMFADFTVTSTKVLRTPDGASRGVGFVK